MRVQGFEKRLERAEQAAKAEHRFSTECICFPEDEPPFFAFGIEFEMLTRVKCPLHGERFTPRFHIYVAKWLRAKQPQLIWTHHSEIPESLVRFPDPVAAVSLQPHVDHSC